MNTRSERGSASIWGILVIAGAFTVLLGLVVDGGQIIDQWVGSNAVEMLAQMGWGFAPVGEVASPPG